MTTQQKMAYYTKQKTACAQMHYPNGDPEDGLEPCVLEASHALRGGPQRHRGLSTVQPNDPVATIAYYGNDDWCVGGVHDSYELIRVWHDPSKEFQLRVYDTHSLDRLGKTRLAYVFYDLDYSLHNDPAEEINPVFVGDDFCASPMHAIDSDETVAALLGFLSLREGDTDAEYFEDYSVRQLDWRDARAEQLGFCANKLLRARRLANTHSF